jgi:hypothetical protein
MARAPSEEPEGLVYRPELISVEDEAELLEILDDLRFDPIVLHGQPAKRTGRHFGLDYDYEARTPVPAAPVPEWIFPVRSQARGCGQAAVPARQGRAAPRLGAAARATLRLRTGGQGANLLAFRTLRGSQRL